MNELFEKLQNLHSRNPLARIFVILDTGKDESYYEQLQTYQYSKLSLFANTLEEYLQNIGPWIIELDKQAIADKSFIDWLDKTNSEHQAIIWLFGSASLDLSKVALHLQNRLNWFVNNHDIALIRFYDQEVIARFIDVLTDEQKVYFFGDITSFGVFSDNKYNLIKKPTLKHPVTLEQNTLSEKQIKILNLPERDSYLKKLLIELQETSNHAAVYHANEKQVLTQMKEGWDIAIKWGVYSLPTLSEWAAMSILMPQFYKHESVRVFVTGAKSERETDLHARDVLSLMRYDLNKLIQAQERK